MSVELRGASVVRSGRAILEDATFACEPGTLTAFCGPNGAGKTTALSLLTSALKPDRGAVLFEGDPLASYKPVNLARQRAVVAQSSVLGFPFQVHEVVAMGRTPHHGRSSVATDHEVSADVMQAMDITPFAERNYLTLSGGERQRVNIARALAQVWRADEAGGATRWLFLDEPTAALDLKHQIALVALLKQLASEGWGIVAVLHDLHLVQAHADTVVLFREGRVASIGGACDQLSAERIQDVFGLDAPYELTA